MTSKKVKNVLPPLPVPQLRTMAPVPLPERAARNDEKKTKKWEGIPENYFRNPKNYHQNDVDVRPGSSRKRYRDDRPMTTGNDPYYVRGGHKTKLPYERLKKPSNDSYDSRFISKNNNGRQNPIEEKCFNQKNNGLEYNRTSDKYKVDWQTKQQMDDYGLLGGCCRNGDHKTHQCHRSEQTSTSSNKSGRRARSMSRSLRDTTRKPLLGILKRNGPKPPVRSRSVCFKEKNEVLFFERHSELEQRDLEKEDIESKVNHTIDVEKELSFEKNKPLRASDERSEMVKSTNFTYDVEEPNQLDSKSNIPLERRQGLDDNVTTISPPSLINEATLKIPKMTWSKIQPERKFHGFSRDDLSNEMAQLAMRTLVIQVENKYVEDCHEFAQNYYDVIINENLGQDKIGGLFENADSCEFSQAEVQNNQIILEHNKTDATPQSYFTPIHDIQEDGLDLASIVESSFMKEQPFLKSQEEMFQIETNVAVNNVHVKNGVQFDQTQPTQCNKKLSTNKTKACQSILKSSITKKVLKNTKTTKKDTKIDKENPLANNNSAIDPKTSSFKMMPVRVSVENLKLNRNSEKIVPLLSNKVILKREDRQRNLNLKTLFVKQDTREDSASLQVVSPVVKRSTDTIGETPGDKSISSCLPRPPSCIIRFSQCTLDENDP